MNVYLIPVIKKGRQVGLLKVVSKDNGFIYKTVYQNMAKFNPETGGEITIEINKRFVAKGEYTLAPSSRSASRAFVGGITEVADVNTTFAIRLKSRSESVEPGEDEGWWDCTTRCYKEYNENQDLTNQMLCDLLAVFVDACTVTEAVGCAVICAV